MRTFSCFIQDESWVSDISLSNTFRRAQRTLENLEAASITLDEKDLKEIQHVLDNNPITGTRYQEPQMKHVWG